jgi:hypothetical protein
LAVPDNLSIATEACLMLNSPHLIPKARDEWIPQIQSEIQLKANAKFLLSLQEVSYTVTVKGKAYYAMPTDMAISGSGIIMTLLSGTNTGTVTGGAADSITLDDLGGVLDDTNMIGKEILVTAASAGGGSISNCTAYVNGSDQATVKPDFNTIPLNGDSYLIVDSYTPIVKEEYASISVESKQGELGEPKNYYQIKDSDDGEFLLHPVPDGVYGIQFVYTIDLTSVSYTSSLWTKLLYRWRSIFIWGIIGKILMSKELYPEAFKAFNRVDGLIGNMIVTE